VKKLCSRGAQLVAASVLVSCTPAHVVQGNGPTGTQVPHVSQIAVGGAPQPHSLVYPVTARVNVSDDYSGTQVSDPYRWLENLDSEVTRRWVHEQNGLSQPRLEALPQRAWVKQRLLQLWNYERFCAPVKEGTRYFFLHNDGTQNQSVLFVSEALDSPGRVLFDPNAVREDATVALADFTPSPNGKLLAYALSDGGTDWETWKFRSAQDGADLPDTLRYTKFWGVSWARDASGVFYSRYPALSNGKGDDSGRPAIYFHRLGEPQERDRLIFAVTDHPTRVPAGRVTEDGRFLVITLFDGYARNGVSLLDLRHPANKATALFAAWDALYTFIGSHGDELYFLTTRGAPHREVIAVNAQHPASLQTPSIIVPESDVALEYVSYVGGRVIAQYVRDAHSVVQVFERNGRPVGEVSLPGLGTVDGFQGEGRHKETFFSYTDYLTPPQIYHYDIRANTASLWRKPAIAADARELVTEQVFYTSKDGTRVPLSITHRRDMVRDGDQPFLLYGYGGFDVSLTPQFSPSVLAWLELGGAYAVANLRGGGEYGEQWHLAGTLADKQNVFDDFIAAAEFLIRERYTRPQRLGIHGRSNGGLLIGAVMTQRPELFGAALPAVGVLDMLRYQTASANARQWSSDYGLSENPQQLPFLLAYSPYHTVKKGVCYPPTLVTTADHDDRVAPWHSYKFAAALQEAQGCPNPLLIRVETRAGHGAGKPVWMQIEDFADQWAFAADALRMSTPR
jgi:prolyl oligopeptidase